MKLVLNLYFLFLCGSLFAQAPLTQLKAKTVEAVDGFRLAGLWVTSIQTSGLASDPANKVLVTRKYLESIPGFTRDTIATIDSVLQIKFTTGQKDSLVFPARNAGLFLASPASISGRPVFRRIELTDLPAGIGGSASGLNDVLAVSPSATGKSITLNSSTNAGAFSFLNGQAPTLSLYRNDWARITASTTTPSISVYGSSATVVDSFWCQVLNKGINFNYNATTQANFSVTKKHLKILADSLSFFNSDATTKISIADTVNFKPLQINASGLIRRSSFWPVFDSSYLYLEVAKKASLTGANFTGSIGIGTSPDVSSLLDVSSTNKGVLIPRVTTAQMNAISSPADGLQVYNTTEKAVYFYNSDWGWESNALSYKRKFGVEYFNELTTATPSDGVIVSSLSNGGTIAALSGLASRTGIQAPSTSTNAAARYTLSTDATALTLGSGRVLFEEVVRIPTLSNATDAFYHFFGLSAQITAASQTNAVLFIYDSSGTVTGSTANGFWQVMTASAGNRTFTTTSIPVVANQWYKLTGIVNAAGTSVSFYIDDILVAPPHTTNIPTAAMGFVSNLQKSAGTTARTINLDYLYFKQKYTTSR